MGERVVMASTFKQQCLALLDQVEQKKVSVLVTKRGRPVARLVPLDDAAGTRSTDGSVTLIADQDESYFSTGEGWHASG